MGALMPDDSPVAARTGGPGPSVRRAVLATALAIAPLTALLTWAASAPQEWVPARRAVGADGVAEIPMRAYTWGFDQKIVRVNPNDLVRFRVQSEDIQHGFAINELGINLQLVPGREVRSPAVRAALPEGRYTIHCSIFCGLGHPSMKATLVVGNPGPAPAGRLPWIASVLALAAAGGAVALFGRRSRSGA